MVVNYVLLDKNDFKSFDPLSTHWQFFSWCLYIYTHTNTHVHIQLYACVYIYILLFHISIFFWANVCEYVLMYCACKRTCVYDSVCVCEGNTESAHDVLFYSICVPPALCGIVRHQFEIKTCDVGKAYRTWREYKIFDQNTFELCPRRRKNSDEQKTGSRVNPLLLRASGSRIF